MSVVLCRLDEIADGESRGFEHELEDDDIEHPDCAAERIEATDFNCNELDDTNIVAATIDPPSGMTDS